MLDTVVIYPTAPQNKVEQAKKVLKDLIEKYHVTLISLGNGTASRESEQIIADFLKEIPEDVRYVIVNEAGRRYIRPVSWPQRNSLALTWDRGAPFPLPEGSRTRWQSW